MTDKAKRIVEALRMCPVSGYSCNDCPVYTPGITCQNELNAADLIESLSAELEQVKQERDAAVEDLRSAAYCGDCVNYTTAIEVEPCKACFANRGFTKPNWQWRRVKED